MSQKASAASIEQSIQCFSRFPFRNQVNRQPRGHLDEATTLLFGAQLISAVAHMHALHVVHRDLKTKNIMLSKRGDQVKIVDFGLGRTWSRARPLLTHCGSPGYAAPEIYQRDRSLADSNTGPGHAPRLYTVFRHRARHFRTR